MHVVNLPVWNVLFSCSAATSDLFHVFSESSSNSFIVCVLDEVCRAQSVLQSECRKLCVHPTWFMCNEAIVCPRAGFRYCFYTDFIFYRFWPFSFVTFIFQRSQTFQNKSHVI